MKLSHATALFFVGWYLMMPPVAADLDQSCSQYGWVKTSTLFLSALSGKSPRQYEAIRCDQLRHTVAAYAPMTAWPDTMSTWRKLREFETLAACQSQYQNNQSTTKTDAANIAEAAASELIEEDESDPTEQELKLRLGAIEKGLMEQIAGERCIASDPNLAKVAP